MKPEIPGWSHMRRVVLLFAGAATLGATLLAGSVWFSARMEQQHRQRAGQLHEIRQRYQAVDEQEGIIRDYLPRFQALQETGLWGEERRLNWVETLQDAGHALGLPSLEYQIKAQRPYGSGAHAHSHGFGVFVSEMALNMRLLHEGDLFALLNLLDERAKGLYTVSGCELTRNFAQLADDPEAGNITADCLLQWFSIKLVDDAGPNA